MRSRLCQDLEANRGSLANTFITPPASRQGYLLTGNQILYHDRSLNCPDVRQDRIRHLHKPCLPFITMTIWSCFSIAGYVKVKGQRFQSTDSCPTMSQTPRPLSQWIRRHMYFLFFCFSADIGATTPRSILSAKFSQCTSYHSLLDLYMIS